MPVLYKHSRNLDLVELISTGVDKVQRNFEPVRRQTEDWQTRVLEDDRAMLILYAKFVDGQLGVLRRLLPVVHRTHFHPELEGFQPRTLWSLLKTFTSVVKELVPMRQFQTMAKVGAFLNGFNAAHGPISPRASRAGDPAL